MWIKAIAGVVTELDRSGRMAGFGGLLGGGIVVGGFRILWAMNADFGSVLHRRSQSTSTRVTVLSCKLELLQRRHLFQGADTVNPTSVQALKPAQGMFELTLPSRGVFAAGIDDAEVNGLRMNNLCELRRNP